jgi:hypothetical protein
MANQEKSERLYGGNPSQFDAVQHPRSALDGGSVSTFHRGH